MNYFEQLFNSLNPKTKSLRLTLRPKPDSEVLDVYGLAKIRQIELTVSIFTHYIGRLQMCGFDANDFVVLSSEPSDDPDGVIKKFFEINTTEANYESQRDSNSLGSGDSSDDSGSSTKLDDLRSQ